ncbi:MAG: RnfABCDGE type electron transport complex subunit D [Planctomycetales bacterium]
MHDVDAQVAATAPGPPLEAVAGPHIVHPRLSTRSMMRDVVIGLAAPLLAALYFFRTAALQQLAICLVCAWLTEWICCRMRGRPSTLSDGSVTVTALIFALSLPPLLSWYATAIGMITAVALGKMAFGGLGFNVFNPAMVGRAFLMLSFPIEMTSWADPLTVHATTQATPLAAAKFSGQMTDVAALFFGNVSGSLGETSALAMLVGGLWILWRRAADWRLTFGMIVGVAAMGLLQSLTADPSRSLGVLRHLCAGSVLFAAFFIVTDPVTSPLTRSGRWMFGLLVGVLTMTIRWFGGYPEGVMFSVLLANAVVPLIDRATPTTPVGGKVPVR